MIGKIALVAILYILLFTVPENMATKTYSSKEKENLVGYLIFLLVPLGESMAGKTSLLR